MTVRTEVEDQRRLWRGNTNIAQGADAVWQDKRRVTFMIVLVLTLILELTHHFGCFLIFSYVKDVRRLRGHVHVQKAWVHPLRSH